jgi:ubiquinone/menaquinone biosynthesis C-methylase UbiE
MDFLRANMRGGEIIKPLHPADVKKIIPKLIKENEFQVPNGSIDLFFCAKVLHEIEGFPKFFAELNRVMMKEGVVFILDWKKEKTEQGPPLEHRIDIKDAIVMFKKTGYQIEKYGEIFTDYYYLIAKTPA